jgi:hypothetical protein
VPDKAAADERRYPRDLPSDELICLPLLDTEVTKDMPPAMAELKARGYPVWLVHLLRGLAFPGLWYQVVAWEWGSIGAYDVLLGYGVLFVIASPFVAILSNLLFGTLTWEPSRCSSALSSSQSPGLVSGAEDAPERATLAEKTLHRAWFLSAFRSRCW